MVPCAWIMNGLRSVVGLADEGPKESSGGLVQGLNDRIWVIVRVCARGLLFLRGLV